MVPQAELRHHLLAPGIISYRKEARRIRREQVLENLREGIPVTLSGLLVIGLIALTAKATLNQADNQPPNTPAPILETTQEGFATPIEVEYNPGKTATNSAESQDRTPLSTDHYRAVREYLTNSSVFDINGVSFEEYMQTRGYSVKVGPIQAHGIVKDDVLDGLKIFALPTTLKINGKQQLLYTELDSNNQQWPPSGTPIYGQALVVVSNGSDSTEFLARYDPINFRYGFIPTQQTIDGKTREYASFGSETEGLKQFASIGTQTKITK